MVESGRSLRARSKTSYAEMDEDIVIDEVGIPEVPVVTTTTSYVSATNTSYVVSRSSACITATTSLVSSTRVSMAADYALSPLASISVTDLQRQVDQARAELQKRELDAELKRLQAKLAVVDVPVVTPIVTPSTIAPPPSIEHVSTAVSEPRLDLPSLRADSALAKKASREIKRLGVDSSRRRHARSPSSSSSSTTSEQSTFSDSSTSSEEERRRRKKKKKKRSRAHKSGKFAKPTSKVQFEQDWPQAFLSLKYVTQAKKYEALSTAEFVAGYASILEQPKMTSSERQARIAHLRQLMYLATIHRWSAVLDFHAAVLNEIERGQLKWTDSFDSILSHFVASHSSKGSSSQPRTGGSTTNKNTSTTGTYFCRQFNNSACSKTGPHSDMVNGRLVTVQHICSECYMADRSLNFHPKSSCPARASTVSGTSLPPATSG